MNKKESTLGLVILSILVINSFSFSAFAQDQTLSIIENTHNSNSAKFIPGQLVVGLEKPDISFNDKIILHGGHLINSIEEINAFVVKVPLNTEDKFISAMSNNPNVSYIERDVVMTASYVPNDTFYSAQWGLQRIGMESVWQPNFTLGSGIIVAVVDTGIYPDHPDFVGTNILTDSDWDFVDDDADTRPTKVCNKYKSAEFHATFVAGIIASSSDNDAGVTGIGPFDILPVRVLDHCGAGSSSAVANGILWAKNNGADVINLSLGSSVPSTVILNAVNEAYAADVIIVAASGNDGNDSVSYPAGFSNVISVGAITNTDSRAPYSQYGNTLELSAPGGSDGTCSSPVTPFIVSTGAIVNGQTPEFAYLCGTGTSFAAPHVSGVVGLVKAANPNATNDEIRLHLQQTSEDLGPTGYDVEFGHGVVRADSALSVSINPSVPNIPTITTTPGITNITPTTIDGTGDIGTIIELFNGVTSLGTQTVDGSGDWQFTNVALVEGDNSFTATASDGIKKSAASSPTVITLEIVTSLSPLAHYLFEDNLSDSTGNGNIGTINIDGSEIYVVGLDGKAFDFDGSTHITIANEENFDFDSTNPFSIAYWIKTSSGTGWIVTKNDPSNQGIIHYFRLPGNPSLFLKDTNGIFAEKQLNTNIADGTWHHIAVTYDGSGNGNGINYYVDGALDTNTTIFGGTHTGSLLNNNEVTVGASNSGGFKLGSAQMDVLGIYDFKLNEEQVSELFLP